MIPYFIRILKESSAPVWLNLVSALVGGVAVWLLIPNVNQAMEYQRLRSAFIVKSLDDLNSTTSDYLGYVSEVSSMEEGAKVSPETIGATARITTRLQWRAMELASLLKAEDDQKLVETFQKSLNDLQAQIRELNKGGKRLDMDVASLAFLKASFALASRVTDVSQMSIR